VKTDKGFHVLKLTQRRPAFTRPFAEVKRQIQTRLYHEGRIRYADIARPTPPPVRRYPRATWRSTERIEDTVYRVVSEVADTEPGNRNNRLSSASFFLGKLVQSGKLSMEHAVYQLGQAARQAQLPLHEASTTVKLGLMAGMRKEVADPYEQRNPSVGRGTARGQARAF
jgi:hypothetical protein